MANCRASKPALPKEWHRFATQYGEDRAYWYVPKGLAVTPQSLKARLSLLAEFEGSSQPWRALQQRYVRRLNEKGISTAAAECPDGGAPLARMLKRVFAGLGLAWVHSDERVEITPAGRKFLAAQDPGAVLSDQLSRFQFWNPGVLSKAHREIKLHPIPFLGEILRNIGGQSITAVEYNLFVSRAKSFSDVDCVLDHIERFRALEEALRNCVVDACESYMLGGRRRTSIYQTIDRDRPYALKMWALSRLIEIDAAGGLALEKGALKSFRSYLAEYAREGAYIEFANERDWIAYFGDHDAPPTIGTALDYYESKGDVAAAVAAKKRQAASARELADFKDMILSEKAVEDYLEGNLDVIGSKIGARLELVGRQYSTPVGPIDLLTRGSGTGEYVVVELKKGRSADKVYGQCSRYMGWVRKNLASDGRVYGVIVAGKIDEKLKAARDAHDTKVHLLEFEMKLGASLV